MGDLISVRTIIPAQTTRTCVTCALGRRFASRSLRAVARRIFRVPSAGRYASLMGRGKGTIRISSTGRDASRMGRGNTVWRAGWGKGLSPECRGTSWLTAIAEVARHVVNPWIESYTAGRCVRLTALEGCRRRWVLRYLSAGGVPFGPIGAVCAQEVSSAIGTGRRRIWSSVAPSWWIDP